MKYLFTKTYLPAMLCTVGSFIFLILPGKSLPGLTWAEKIFLDKWVHAGMFFMVALVWAIKIKKENRHPINKKRFKQIFSIAIAYGIVMEIVQHYFVQGRTFDVLDILANSLGAALAYWIGNKNWS